MADLVNSPYVVGTFEWHPETVERATDRALQATALELADDIEAYLHATLHRWTGEMADKAYGIAQRTATGWLIRGGSDTDHTFWHEVRYHPQLRQTMDVFSRQIGERVAQHLRQVTS